MKKTVVILGHQSNDSFCAYLSEKYCEGAKASGNEIEKINVGELDFAPFLKNEYLKEQIMEPDIKNALT